MYCKNCGFQMADDHQICQNCGTKRGEGRTFCENCGAVLNVNSSFCTNCGSKIEVAATAQNAQNTQNEYSTPYSQQTPAQQFASQSQQPNSQYLPPKKYCRNCGAQVLNSQAVCTKCNTKVGEGSSYCPHCAAPVQPGAQNCTSCGKSLKEPFNFGKYFNQFADNFVSIFKTSDKKTMILENFINFAAVLIFIVMLLPIISAVISVNVFGTASLRTTSYNTFSINAFAGVLLILSLLTAVIKYEPFCVKFMKSQPMLAKFYVLVTPALEFISFIIIIINFLQLKSASTIINGYYSSLGGVAVNLTFFGWLLIILIFASIGDAVYLFIKQYNKKHNQSENVTHP